jgi:hypothetical protein
MNAPASTIPEVKTYLVELITAAVNDPAVLVCYDDPGTNQPDDIIAVRDVEQTLAPYELVGGGGPGWLFETYKVEVVVDVYRGGDFPRLVFERACALVAIVENAIRADPSLAGRVLTARPAGTHYASAWEDDGKGRTCAAAMTVDVEARS